MQKKNIKTALVSLYCLESLGIIAISSYLLSKGKDVINIFLRDMPRSPGDFLDQRQISKFIDFLKKEGVDIVGISFISTFYKEAVELSTAIRESSDMKTIFGGYHASLCPEECIPYGDMVCIGEGEEALLEIIEKMENGDPFESVKGTWCRNGERIIKNENRPLIKNLDKIYATLDFANTKTYLYLADDDICLKGNRQDSYHTVAAKGCPFNCTYCNSSSMHRIADEGSQFFRKRSVDNLMSELIKAKNFYPNITAVHFHNEVFPYYGNELDEFCRRYKESINLPFTAFFHFSFLNEETINKLREAGLSRLSLGLQTGSERFRRQVYNRMETNKKILEVRDAAVKAGLPLSFDILLSPLLDTKEALKEAISFYLDLGESVFLKLYKLTFLPKTAITEKLIQRGVLRNADQEQYARNILKVWHFNFLLLDIRDKLTYFYYIIFLIRKLHLPVSFYRFLVRRDNLINFFIVLSLILIYCVVHSLKGVSRAAVFFIKNPGRENFGKSLLRLKKALFLFEPLKVVNY